MARGINKVIIVGNLGADPEVRYTGSGTAITSLRIATSENWTDKQSGERQERTEWHRVKLFGKLAEIAGEYLKKGRQVVPDAGLEEMARIAHQISEVTNVAPDTHQPYVGLSAFAHKAGLHASAIKVDPMLYQHIDPALVGNDMRMLVSDMAGRASVELKGKELGYDLSGDKAALGRVVDRVKELEARGYTFEAADASFELLLRGELSLAGDSSRAGEPGPAEERYFSVETFMMCSSIAIEKLLSRIDMIGMRSRTAVSKSMQVKPIAASPHTLMQSLSGNASLAPIASPSP